MIQLMISLDFLALSGSFFVLASRCLPKIWLDSIAKGIAAILLAAVIIKFFQ